MSSTLAWLDGGSDGDAGPEPLGLAAGAFGGNPSDALGLQNALAVIPLAGLGAALLFIVAARSYEADKQRLAGIHLSVDDAAPGPASACPAEI